MLPVAGMWASSIYFEKVDFIRKLFIMSLYVVSSWATSYDTLGKLYKESLFSVSQGSLLRHYSILSLLGCAVLFILFDQALRFLLFSPSK